MHKVVIERPRRNPGPNKQGRRANLSDELLPKFEGIRRPHQNRKWFTDLLGPLRRWLRSNVGRPWNDVYSEACAVIKPDSVVRAHIKTHLLQFVERHTFIHDRKVCVLETGFRGRGIVPVEELHYSRDLFFVHPETGLLQAAPSHPKRAWRAPDAKPPSTVRWLGKSIALQQIRGLWFECHFEAVPFDLTFKSYDHAMERYISCHELIQSQAEHLFCTRKRQLSKRELRQLDLRNMSTLLPFEVQSSTGTVLSRLTTVLQVLAGRRWWVIKNPVMPVQIRSVACDGGATFSTPGGSIIAPCPLTLVSQF